MEGIASLIFADLVTIPLTALVCRYRIRRHKPISYGTMACCVFLGTVLFVIGSAVYYSGWEVFWSTDGWLNDKFFSHGTAFTILFCLTLACILPAVWVGLYYRRRDKKDATHVTYTLDSGIERHRESPDIFHLPSQAERETLKPGVLAIPAGGQAPPVVPVLALRPFRQRRTL